MSLNNVEPFRYWAHKIIPLVYDDSLSYYEFLAKVVAKLNEVISQENEQNEYITTTFSNIMSDLTSWKTAVDTELALWKTTTESDISTWETSTLSALDDWKSAFQTVWDATFTNLVSIKTDAEAARDSAIDAKNSAEAAAESVSSSSAQIATNASDIVDLRTAMNAEFQDELGIVFQTGWVNGYFIGTNSDTVDITSPTQNSNYSYLVLPCSAGDIFRVTGTGSSGAWAYVFISSTGAKLSEQPTNIVVNQVITAPENVAYAVFNSRTSKKVYKGTSRMDAEANAIEFIQNDTINVPFSFIASTYINYTTGASASNSGYHATDYLAIADHVNLIETNCRNPASGVAGYAFYDSTKTFISGSGGQLSKFGITRIAVPDTAKYVRISSQLNLEESGVDRYIIYHGYIAYKNNTDYKVVMLGDSIIGNYDDATSVPHYLEIFSGAKCFNCAFGGSNLATDTVGSINQLLLPFRGFKVIESICSNNYADMDSAIAQDPSFQTLNENYPVHVNTLKNMDWNSVDIIVMSWGSNDWSTSVKLDDNTDNLYDTDTIGGALRTALETLWTTYPHIKVLICGPVWRGGPISGGELDYDSDDHVNARNKYLKEYSDKERDVAKEYHAPFVEMYDYTNFNKFTWKNYFPPSASNAVHPNAKGRYVIAKRYSQFLAEI